MTAFRFILPCFLLAIAGCKPTLTCEDIPCPYGQFCNVFTGECQTPDERCLNDDDCRSDEVCDVITELCVPAQLRCTDQFTCPVGQSCDAQTGFCEPESLCSRDGCGIAETCNQTTEQCEPSACNATTNCPPEFTCSNENVCVAGCVLETDCPDASFCSINPGQAIGVCEPSCRADADCPFGRFCDLEGDPPLCENEPPCLEDTDCRVDEVCRFQTCSQPPCFSEEDCFEGQFCNIATGSCIDIDCEEDIYGRGELGEPNHAYESAFTIDAGDYRNLQLCPGSEDWFRVSFRSTDIVTINLRSLSTGELDVAVFDEQQQLVANDRRIGSIATVTFAAQKTGASFVRISSFATESIEYNLEITTDFCQNDLFEENDSAENAKVVPININVPVELPLRSCVGDEDWFRLPNIDPEDGLRVERTQSVSDLAVSVIDPDGVVFDVTNEKPFQALRVGVEGDYLVRAITEQSSAPYGLNFERLPSFVCDANEHAEPLSAVPPLEAIGQHLLCPDDGGWETDWIALPTLDGLAEVRVSVPGEPALDVVIWEGDADDVQIVRGASFDGTELVAVFAADPAKQYWMRISSDDVSDRILGLPIYGVNASAN